MNIWYENRCHGFLHTCMTFGFKFTKFTLLIISLRRKKSSKMNDMVCQLMLSIDNVAVKSYTTSLVG